MPLVDPARRKNSSGKSFISHVQISTVVQCGSCARVLTSTPSKKVKASLARGHLLNHCATAGLSSIQGHCLRRAQRRTRLSD